MAKAVKDHRNKKNSQSYESWRRRNKEMRQSTGWDVTEKRAWQKRWRKDCLVNRSLAGKLTEKNKIEMKNLGMVV